MGAKTLKTIPISPDISVRGKELAKLARSKRTAAVLVPICRVNGEIGLLYQKRSENVSTHKNQVSFPGGHIEVDEGPEEAAIREMQEEVGFNGQIHIIGHMDEVPALTGTMVTPIIGVIQGDLDLGELSLSSEVEKVFFKSLDWLDEAKKTELREHKGVNYTMPYYGDGDERVWGLTAWITEGALAHLVDVVQDVEVYS